MLPSIFGENLFDDWFGFPGFPELRDMDRKLYGKRAGHMMKTDVREHGDRFELDMDLPGFTKDEITLDLENGYLTVKAAKGLDNTKTDDAGKVIRQERYAGAMQRSFYVGEQLTAEDVSARFENGVLRLTLPKKDPKALPKKTTIAIGD